MCVREMTLGEEILNLTRIGVDIQTVERIYKKYIQFGIIKNTEYCIADVVALAQIYKIGDQIEIHLGNLGTFTATVQMVKDDRVLFLFDDYITKRPMNGSNEVGYEKSDLKKWIENDLFKMFPEALRKHMTGLTIPTLGEICGWGDSWDKEHIEPDSDEQLPLMKQRRNRVAYYNNDCAWGWLRNATKKEFSSASFALVNGRGDAFCSSASDSGGVRPEFWLVR